MKIVADNFTVSNPLILEKLKNFDEKFFENFFNNILAITNKIDLNFGQLKKNINDYVKFIFTILNSFNKKLEVFIDTININTIEECLKYCKKPPVLNAISYDEFKLNNILPIAVNNNLKIVSLLIEKKVPLTLDDKVSLALKLIDKITEKGLPLKNIILDPVVAPLGWENGALYNKNNLEMMKIKSEIFPVEIKFMMGISNLTTGATGKNRSVKKIDSYYLAMAYSYGLDYALINVFNKNLNGLLQFIKILEDNLIFSPAIFQE